MVEFSAAFASISIDYKVKAMLDALSLGKNDELNILVIAFLVYKLAHHLIYFVRRVLAMCYEPIIVEDTVQDFYKKITKHSLHWFESHMSGEISSKVFDFQSGIITLICYCSCSLNIIITILFIFCFLLKVNLLSASVVGLFVLIYTPVLVCVLRKQIKLQSDYVGARQNTMGIINDSIVNIFSIKNIGSLTSEFILKFKPAIANWKLLYRKTKKFDALVIDNLDTLLVVSMNIVQLYLAVYLYRQNMITAGGFAFIVVMTVKIHSQLEMLLEHILFTINPNIAQVKASYNFINKEIEVKDAENPVVFSGALRTIQYKNVSFAYKDFGRSILHNLNLNIKFGDKIGIVGASGAGKTTLIKCLLRYFDVQHGGIFINDINIKDLKQKTLSSFFSVIPQDISMFHRSIEDNLKVAKYDASKEEIIEACKKSRIHHDIIAMKDGYDTIVGERGISLSGGQRQRIAIARAILKDASVFILDEATSSLDVETEKLLQDSIADILSNKNITVIAIAHRLSSIQNMGRIIVIENGKIVEDGSHDELIEKQDGVYKKLWTIKC